MVSIFGLIAFALVIVCLSRIKYIFSLAQHIDIDDVKCYKRGQLTEDDRRHVTRHISYCRKCRQLMLDTDPDDHLEHLVE